MPNVHEIRGWRLGAPETQKYDTDTAKIQRTVSQSHLIELLEAVVVMLLGPTSKTNNTNTNVING